MKDNKLIFLNEHTRSLLPKSCIVFVLVTTIIVAEVIIDVNGEGNTLRWNLLLFCALFYICRLLITFFVFFKRKLVWREALTVSPIMSAILFALLYTGGRATQVLNLFDVSGILLFLFGSFINTYSEGQRYFWMNKEKNKGKPYTKGLFSYSMHINYFGDVILFTGFALITQEVIMVLIPLGMALNFIVLIIPTLDEYLERKYGEEFVEYAKHTKKLIPFIY